jgi:LPXTG-site transpeptidase (sortase) family protein
MTRIRERLSRTSTKVVLSILVAVLAIGLIAWDSDPLLAMMVALSRHDRPTYATQLQPHVKPVRGRAKGDRLVVDGVSIDVAIRQGAASAGPLKKGVWLDPQGSTPGAGEPIVIAGHRVTKRFATLPLAKKGMTAIVYWKGTEYDYRIVSIKPINGATGINVAKEAPGTGERLIMYTCTPKNQGDKRYVVVARPIKAKK